MLRGIYGGWKYVVTKDEKKKLSEGNGGRPQALKSNSGSKARVFQRKNCEKQKDSAKNSWALEGTRTRGMNLKHPIPPKTLSPKDPRPRSKP